MNSKEINKFYSEAIGINFSHDYLTVLDIEWILRKINKSSTEAFYELYEREVPRIPKEILFNESKELVFIFLPSEGLFNSLQDLYRLTTRTFNNLIKNLERSQKRENIHKINVKKLDYDGDNFTEKESQEVIFSRREKEKPLTDF